MTLILTALTPEFIVQASDRMLTYPSGDVARSDAVKSVVVGVDTSFGYTGMAGLPVTASMAAARPYLKAGEWLTTSEWIATVAANASSSKLADTALLAAEGAKAMQLIGPRESSKLTIFIRTNWTMNERTGDLEPSLVRISNVMDENRFEYSLTRIGSDRHSLLDTSLKKADLSSIGFSPDSLERRIDEEVAGNSDPAKVLALLVDAVREVSRLLRAKGSLIVGEDVIQTCIPREVVARALKNGSGWTIVNGPASIDYVTFAHNDPTSADVKPVSPVHVLGGNIVGTLNISQLGVRLGEDQVSLGPLRAS